MKKTTSQLTQWVIDKIKTEYSDDVALLIAVDGHSVNDDGHGECFDYFIPATDRGYELSRTFILEGIGHDLYPRSWERTERTANFDDMPTLCLGNARILYSRSKEDEERFLSLKKKMFDNLADKAFIYPNVLELLDTAMNIYRTMMFEDRLYKVRKGVGFIHLYLSNAVLLLNGKYTGYVNNMPDDLSQIKELPDNFIEYYKAVLNTDSISELKSLAHLIINTSRQFITAHKPEKNEEKSNPDFADLADWYQELCLSLRRIRYYCEIGNGDAAFGDACYFQNEFDIIRDKFGLQEQDLLSSFNISDLSVLSKRTDEIETYIVSEIENHGAIINKYDSIEDFLRVN